MKRTSILVLVACFMTQQIAIARYRVPESHRVRYSMHAFGHNRSGLVPRCVKYSPHAFGVNNSGLIHAWTRYSLHAFGVKHNGLISEYGYNSSGAWLNNTRDLNQQGLTKAIDRLARSINNTNSRCRTTRYITHNVSSVPSSNRRVTANVKDLNSDNPRLLVRAVLNTLIPGEFKVSQLLRVDKEVVSFNVVIENRNLVIKYWNPAKVRSINEASNQKTEQLSDYMKQWAASENMYDNSGERVVHIISTDQDKIIGELASCLQTKTM
jgi:hypothetical protein